MCKYGLVILRPWSPRGVIWPFWASVSSFVKEEACSIRKGRSKERGRLGQRKNGAVLGRKAKLNAAYTGGAVMASSSLCMAPCPVKGSRHPLSPPSVDSLRDSLTVYSPQETQCLALGLHPSDVCWINEPKLEPASASEKRAGSSFPFPVPVSGEKRAFLLPQRLHLLCPSPSSHRDGFGLAPLQPLVLSHLPFSLFWSFLCLCALFVWQVPWELAKPWGHFPVTDTL